MAYFFVYPFGTSGNKTTVPTSGSISGSMSYEFGFTTNYELELGVDAGALPVPRDQTNQLYFDITTAIRQYQTLSVPDWIASVDNLGSPFSYGIYARVRYDAGGGVQVYENQVANNTAVPGVDSTWTIISGNATGVPTGTVIDFAGVTPPSGYLKCDGSAVVRSTYVSLKSEITFTQNGTTTNTLATISGLTSTADMFAGMPLEGTGITTGTTILSVDGPNDITMNAPATASATVPITFYPWGAGNGTTTFNVPDLRRMTTIGEGGSGTATIGNLVGQTGGEESHLMTTDELVAHVHPPLSPATSFTGSTGGAQSLGGGGDHSEQGSTGINATAGNAFNIIQKSAVMNKCIKT